MAFKTMEQVLEAENKKLKARIAELERELTESRRFAAPSPPVMNVIDAVRDEDLECMA